MTKFGYDKPTSSRLAMDIKQGATSALRDLRQAEKDTAPVLGANFAMDGVTSAADLYGAALRKLGIKTEGVHPSAYAGMFQLAGRSGFDGSRTALAADAASRADFDAQFPSVARIKKL